VNRFWSKDAPLGKTVAWALYDWANSAFATTVMAGFFPVFFKQYWSHGTDPTVSTFQLGVANSLGSVLVAAIAPILGAIADRGGARKRFLAFFAVMGIVMTGAMPLVARGDWVLAAALYVIASVGFAGANIFYDALIVLVAPEEERDVVSALGFAMGYLGGGLLFALNIVMTLHPGAFGLPDQAAAVKASFVTVAVWWALFSVPVMLFVKEARPPVRRPPLQVVASGFRELAHTFQEIRRLRVVLLFLIGYWLYIDGVDTIVRMAVDFGMSIGFRAESLMIALLIVQFVGFPAGIAFGQIGRRLGAKTGIFIGLAVYLGVTVWGLFMDQEWEFYLMAVMIGLVQGGVQALSRSLYSRLIPPSRSGEFFGFYNMLGKFAAVIGPVLMGWVGVLTGSSRLAILAVAVLFLSGGLLLFLVDEATGRREAAAYEAEIAARRGE
jgi:UMF1 family MFS transporter